MRKHNLLKAVALTLCLALLSSGTAFAATPGQALDASEVKYGTVSKADQKILKSMFNAEEYAAMNEDVVKVVGKDASADVSIPANTSTVTITATWKNE